MNRNKKGVMTSQTGIEIKQPPLPPDTKEKPDPESFEKIARTIFAPVYPVIAAQIVEATGITRGFCLDIGCGGGHLGMAMAELGTFDVGFLDPSDGMRNIVARNTAEAGLSSRTRILAGNADAIPLPDNSVDLAISRGSIFFWNDHAAAFREIERILKPGGKAYIGGGFGSAAIREEIIKKMDERGKDNDPSFHNTVSERLGPDATNRFRKTLHTAGMRSFSIIQCRDKGLWIMLHKEEKEKTMVQCDICTRECRIAEGRSGACGKYGNVIGQLVERFADHYLVTCPISAETMPLLHGWPGAVFLQISTLGCNLSCTGCISSILVQGMVAGGQLLTHLPPDRVVAMALEQGCQGIVFLMNDPLASFLTFGRVAKEAKKQGLLVGCSTNGLFTEASLSRLLPDLDFVNIGMKGLTDASYRACGATGSVQVLRNIQTIADTGAHVEISCMLRTDNLDEIMELARYVASVSPHIPLQVMRFIPFEDADLSLEPTIARAEDACRELKTILPFVYLFNSPGTRLLDTVCPDCNATVIRRDFYGPMGAKLLVSDGTVPDSDHCPQCGAGLAITGGIQAKNFCERGFEGGYPFTRALEMVEAMLNALGIFESGDLVRAWDALLKNGGLNAFHHDVQTPETYIASFRRFGTVCDADERAGVLAGYLESKLAVLDASLRGLERRPRVYYAMGTPLFALNPGRMENQLVKRAGGYSVNTELEGEGRPGRTLDVALLNDLNPEVIFISAFIGEPVDVFYQRCLDLGMTADAVKNRRIYAHPAPGWDFGSPRWILGLMFIAQTLHPDRFFPDIMDEAWEFYRLFYGMDFNQSSVNRSFSKPCVEWRIGNGEWGRRTSAIL